MDPHGVLGVARGKDFKGYLGPVRPPTGMADGAQRAAADLFEQVVLVELPRELCEKIDHVWACGTAPDFPDRRQTQTIAKSSPKYVPPACRCTAWARCFT